MGPHRRHVIWVIAGFFVCPFISTSGLGAQRIDLVSLGFALFQDKAVSRDGKTSCQSCHDPAHAFADTHPRSIGARGAISTRNAPSLIGIGTDDAFFWDGRRSRLEDAVLDPFTNPVELGLASREELLAKLNASPAWKQRFEAAFPGAGEISIEQIELVLASFVRSLTSAASAYDPTTLTLTEKMKTRGQQLFEGVAGCSECHLVSNGKFSDGKYHHSGVEQAAADRLPELTKTVIREHLSADEIGPKVLTNSDWSSLGRFVVSHQPADIGAFRTPSLHNVAVTGPYMHDGSVTTLAEAVDREIYYRGLSSGHPINLTSDERKSIVGFLETLTDQTYLDRPSSVSHQITGQ